MHPLFSKADQVSRHAIGAAIEVHRVLGPGLLENIYQQCLLHELKLRGLAAVCEREVQVKYKDVIFHEELRFDVLVEGCLLLELKAVQEIHPIHKAQLLSYMKLLDIPVGLVLNFHELKLVDGVARMILLGADS